MSGPGTERWICRPCARRRWPGADDFEELSVGKAAPTPCADCGEPTMSTIPAPAPGLREALAAFPHSEEMAAKRAARAGMAVPADAAVKMLALLEAYRAAGAPCFACPHCGDPSAWTAEPEPDFHAGANYTCDRCGGAVVAEFLTPEQYVARAGGPCNHGEGPREIVAELFASVDEMPCCGRVCLPGVFTRLWVGRSIARALEAARARERSQWPPSKGWAEGGGPDPEGLVGRARTVISNMLDYVGWDNPESADARRFLDATDGGAAAGGPESGA